MKILHWLRKENSGLFRSTLELATYEKKAGHSIALRQPGEDNALYGDVRTPDVELIHSQFSVNRYYTDTPKFMWMHGEPLSSVGNKISMKAIVDLAPLMDAFLCMRKDEHIIWNSIPLLWVCIYYNHLKFRQIDFSYLSSILILFL